MKRVRLYVELDRSNKGLSRIKENLDCYNAFTRHVDAQVHKDGFVPCVVYIVRSKARRDNIAKLAKSVLGCAWKVAIAGPAATEWLASRLLDEQRAAPPVLSSPEIDALLAENDHLRRSRSAVLTAASELERSCSDLLCRNPNAFRDLGDTDPDEVARWRKDVRTVHDLVRGLKRAG